MAKNSIGRLRQEVSFYQTDRTPDGAGGFLLSGETLLFTVHAEVKPRTLEDPLDAGVLSEQIQYRIRVRERSDINKNLTIRYKGQTLEINTINEMFDYRGYLVILATVRQ